MTPAERTVARIAQNRAIDEKVKDMIPETKKETKAKKPPAGSTAEFVRSTPDERAANHPTAIRKVRS